MVLGRVFHDAWRFALWVRAAAQISRSTDSGVRECRGSPRWRVWWISTSSNHSLISECWWAGGAKIHAGAEPSVCDRGDEAEQLSAAGPVFDHVLDDPDEGGLGGLEVFTGRRGGEGISRRRPRIFGLISRDR